MKKPEQTKDPAAVKRGKAARDRGARGEREVCDILTKLTGQKHKRILGQARDAGHDCTYGPWLLEIKRQERLKFPEWIQQAEEAATKSGLLPGIVWRRDGEQWYIAVRFEEFVQVFEHLRKEATHGTPSDADSGAGAEGPVQGKAATGS